MYRCICRLDSLAVRGTAKRDRACLLTGWRMFDTFITENPSSMRALSIPSMAIICIVNDE